MTASKKNALKIAALVIAGILVAGAAYAVVSTYLYESKKKPIVPSGKTLTLRDMSLGLRMISTATSWTLKNGTQSQRQRAQALTARIR